MANDLAGHDEGTKSFDEPDHGGIRGFGAEEHVFHGPAKMKQKISYHLAHHMRMLNDGATKAPLLRISYSTMILEF